VKKEHQLILEGAQKLSPEIIRAFPKAGTRTGGRKQAQGRSLTDTPEKTEIEDQRAKNGKRKY
jgi:hypothetical protein